MFNQQGSGSIKRLALKASVLYEVKVRLLSACISYGLCGSGHCSRVLYTVKDCVTTRFIVGMA